jgi:hypothetical protein
LCIEVIVAVYLKRHAAGRRAAGVLLMVLATAGTRLLAATAGTRLLAVFHHELVAGCTVLCCAVLCCAVLWQVDGQCCEDNPDALTHHELLLPGHLLLKFFKEKLEDCLTVGVLC